MRRLGRIVALAFALTIACGSLVVLADDASTNDAERDKKAEKAAADHFAEGERAFSRGDFAKAGEAFEAAYAAKPHEAALWNAARSWERAAELARAANLYRRYLRTAPDSAPDTKRAAAALEGLTTKLGRIEIVAPGFRDFAIDGQAISGLVAFVTPGTHLVEGKATGAEAALVSVETTVSAGAVESVLLRAPAPSVSAVVVPPLVPSASAAASASAAPVASVRPLDGSPVAPAERSHHGVSPWLLAPFIGVTATSGGFLVASGIDVLLARSDYETLKKGRSAEDQQQLIDQGRAKSDRTNVLVGVTAGLAVATGLVALFAIDWEGQAKSAPKPPSRASRPSARVLGGPGGVSFEARF